ncbi:MAG: M23 family metallopeptidase, partial [Proteobacteria bacterium]|nr:M23 family metallopeptidase [Candidatus Enterousia avistercoris]
NLSAPFTLSVGQTLKVPDLSGAPVKMATGNAPATAKGDATTAPVKTKISSDPTKKLPTISARSSSKFSWPVQGKILSHYGSKSDGLFNDGINIAAAQGTAVKAAENGVVAYAGNEVKGMGNLIIIQHSGGWMTVYAHMGSMVVRRGAKVSVGQKIGTVGATGKVDTPQLHFEIRKGTKAYNPSSYLK